MRLLYICRFSICAYIRLLDAEINVRIDNANCQYRLAVVGNVWEQLRRFCHLNWSLLVNETEKSSCSSSVELIIQKTIPTEPGSNSNSQHVSVITRHFHRLPLISDNFFEFFLSVLPLSLSDHWFLSIHLKWRISPSFSLLVCFKVLFFGF